MNSVTTGLHALIRENIPAFTTENYYVHIVRVIRLILEQRRDLRTQTQVESLRIIFNSLKT